MFCCEFLPLLDNAFLCFLVNTNSECRILCNDHCCRHNDFILMSARSPFHMEQDKKVVPLIYSWNRDKGWCFIFTQLNLRCFQVQDTLTPLQEIHPEDDLSYKLFCNVSSGSFEMSESFLTAAAITSFGGFSFCFSLSKFAIFFLSISKSFFVALSVSFLDFISFSCS